MPALRVTNTGAITRFGMLSYAVRRSIPRYSPSRVHGMVSAYVDGTNIDSFHFTISSDVDLSVAASQDKLYTGDKTYLSGKLSLNGNPLG